MSEKCIITNKCFRDEFDLPLCEETANDFYTVAEIKHEVEKRILKLAEFSTKYRLSPESITHYEIGSLHNNKAIAELEPIDTNKYIFRISKPAARRCYEKYLDTIIYHELCHALQVDFLLNANIIYFESGALCYDKDQEDIVELLYEKDDGHTKLWYSFVKIINAAFVINPPVARFFTADKDISDAFLESTFKHEKVIIHNRVFSDDFGWLIGEEKA